MRKTTDIMISGGGVAGLTAAAAFGAAGFSVICVEPSPPVTEATAPGADLRTTAFLTPSVAVLEAAGLWARLRPHAAALQVMRIVDAGGKTEEPRYIKDFDSSELSDLPFGYNLPNWLLRREMLARLAELPNVTFLPGLATTAILTRQDTALVTLSDHSVVETRLVIAADGRNSTMRQASGIGVRTLRYGQKALTFAVTHKVPHQNISTEIHRSGGPFTLVPLPDLNGMPASAVVWMERAPEALRLAALPDAAFEAEINARSCLILGPLTLASRRMVWPMIAQIAHRMSGERLALMAEAAHVVPPIGAQGLNMSLADLAALLYLARDNPDGLGGSAMLEAYHRRRHPEVTARVLGIDALNRASMAEAPLLRDLRALGLNALHGLTPIRRTLMRAGLGLR
ncbi:UbiH/UbiF family hydroxylase [bacterium]|nr:UbiH/UbiF family hydroxylase [bacterium]